MTGSSVAQPEVVSPTNAAGNRRWSHASHVVLKPKQAIRTHSVGDIELALLAHVELQELITEARVDAVPRVPVKTPRRERHT